MDFKEKLTALAERVARQKEDVRTEEALGYDIYKLSKEILSTVKNYM